MSFVSARGVSSHDRELAFRKWKLNDLKVILTLKNNYWHTRTEACKAARITYKLPVFKSSILRKFYEFFTSLNQRLCIFDLFKIKMIKYSCCESFNSSNKKLAQNTSTLLQLPKKITQEGSGHNHFCWLELHWFFKFV